MQALFYKSAIRTWLYDDPFILLHVVLCSKLCSIIEQSLASPLHSTSTNLVYHLNCLCLQWKMSEMYVTYSVIPHLLVYVYTFILLCSSHAFQEIVFVTLLLCPSP